MMEQLILDWFCYVTTFPNCICAVMILCLRTVRRTRQEKISLNGITRRFITQPNWEIYRDETDVCDEETQKHFWLQCVCVCCGQFRKSGMFGELELLSSLDRNGAYLPKALRCKRCWSGCGVQHIIQAGSLRSCILQSHHRCFRQSYQPQSTLHCILRFMLLCCLLYLPLSRVCVCKQMIQNNIIMTTFVCCGIVAGAIIRHQRKSEIKFYSRECKWKCVWLMVSRSSYTVMWFCVGGSDRRSYAWFVEMLLD